MILLFYRLIIVIDLKSSSIYLFVIFFKHTFGYVYFKFIQQTFSRELSIKFGNYGSL